MEGQPPFYIENYDNLPDHAQQVLNEKNIDFNKLNQYTKIYNYKNFY